MKNLYLIILVLSLLGCGRSTPTNFYLLESAKAPVQADSLPSTTLRIAQVNTADYLNRNNIVSRVRDRTRLILAEFHLWVEPVGSGIRRVVEEVLMVPMLQKGITVLPPGTEERGDYTLLLDIQRLDGNFDDKAVLDAYWTVLDRNENPVARGTYCSEEMVRGADYDLLVKAESTLVMRMAEYLAAHLPAYMTAKR